MSDQETGLAPARSGMPNAVTLTTIPVQWGDMDAFGHVNNVVYFRWLESARIDLLESTKGPVTMQAGGVGPILASVRCDYRRQLRFPDRVDIGSWVSRIGRTSVDISHAVFSRSQGAVVAEGVSVIVIFDYERQKPVRVPDQLLELWQPEAPDSV